MRVLITVGQVERNQRAENGKSYLTIRDLSSGGVGEFSANGDLDVSALREGSLVRLEAEVQGYGYSISGTSSRGYSLRLLDAKVVSLGTMEELLARAQVPASK